MVSKKENERAVPYRDLRLGSEEVEEEEWGADWSLEGVPEGSDALARPPAPGLFLQGVADGEITPLVASPDGVSRASCSASPLNTKHLNY